MGVFLGLCSIFCEIEHIPKSTVGGLSSVSCASVWVGRLHLLFDVTLARLEANFIFGVSLSDVVVVTLRHWLSLCLARLERTFLLGLSHSDVVVVTLRYW